MSIEILDKGACRAAGLVTTNAPAPPTILAVQGVLEIVVHEVGRIDLILEQPIAPGAYTVDGELIPGELVCLGQVQRPLNAPPSPIPVACHFAPIDEATIELTTWDSAGELTVAAVYFAIFRIPGHAPPSSDAP